MRRKSPKVVWLPQTNANSVGSPTNITSSIQTFVLGVAGSLASPGEFAVGEIPLTIDATGQDPIGTEDTSLSDMFNSGYRLRRIVGKIFVSAHQVANDGPSAIIFTAGIIVRRVDPSTGVSLALTAGIAENIAPSEIRNAADPWVWRRSWLLVNTLATDPAFVVNSGNICNYGNRSGSAVDGAHVDQKTARIVGPEERLFLSCSATTLDLANDEQDVFNTTVHTDLRFVASMRTSVGNRRNASR